MHVLDSIDVHHRLTFDMKRVGHCLYEQRSCYVSDMESDEAGSLCMCTHLERIYSSVKQTPSAPSLHNKIVHASGSAAPVQVPFRCIYAHIHMLTLCLDIIVSVSLQAAAVSLTNLQSPAINTWIAAYKACSYGTFHTMPTTRVNIMDRHMRLLRFLKDASSTSERSASLLWHEQLLISPCLQPGVQYLSSLVTAQLDTAALNSVVCLLSRMFSCGALTAVFARFTPICSVSPHHHIARVALPPTWPHPVFFTLSHVS